MRLLKKGAWLVLLLLAAWAGTALWKGYPPFDAPDRLAEQPETVSAIKSFPEKPPFLYSRRSLAGLCETYGLKEDEIIQRLEYLGIDAKTDWSIKRIGEENDMHPTSVFDTIRQLQE